VFICPHCHKETEIFDRGGGRKAAELFGISFLGEIPLEPKVRVGGDRGVPVVVGNPESAEAKAFMEMARNIAGRVSQENMRVRLPVMQASPQH
ncbi:MAG TPA: P-loop NTPase, partial [Myxococcales bacterium]|nr:P-loop NTPase [Myxococcales bacterium]